MNCDTCTPFAMQTTAPTQPCLQSGTTVYTTTANAGVKQLPLLYLVYQHCLSLFNPTPRKVRATWRAPSFSEKTGNLLTPPWYTFNLTTVQDQFGHLIGMSLAQRVRLLTIWAQLGRPLQEKLSKTLADMIQGGGPDELLPTLEFELFNGTLFDPIEVEGVKRKILNLQERAEQLKREIVILRKRHKMALPALEEYQREFALVREEDLKVAEQMKQLESKATWIRNAARHLFDDNGNLLPEQKRNDIIDLLEDEHPIYSTAVAQLEELQRQYKTGEEIRKALQKRGLELFNQAEQLRARIVGAERRMVESADELEHRLLIQTAYKKELHLKMKGGKEDARSMQLKIQLESLKDDFALQKVNYTNKEIPKLLVKLLSEDSGQGAVRRQIFLFLHPKFKYEWTEPTACRFIKLISYEPFLKKYHGLLTRGLIQPGPYAKLGVFVMNAYTPGSYDSRHRALVQSELQQIVGAMHEYGMGTTIVCHSCGTEEFGDPEARGWIRDHNPPTALVKLAGVCAALGLTVHTDRNFKTGKQVLLPQCLECSTRQGGVTGKIVEILKPLVQNGTLGTIINLRQYINDKLPADDDSRADFVRLILNPKAAWLTLDRSGVNDSLLITTGGAGSFAGIDEDHLGHLGDTLGCHTCTTPGQTDPYRNTSWIADHQPPTSLVERGLMELPQVVYPHCQRCSNTQSGLLRELCAIFDQCFTSGFSESWTELVKSWGDKL